MQSTHWWHSDSLYHTCDASCAHLIWGCSDDSDLSLSWDRGCFAVVYSSHCGMKKMNDHLLSLASARFESLILGQPWTLTDVVRQIRDVCFYQLLKVKLISCGRQCSYLMSRLSTVILEWFCYIQIWYRRAFPLYSMTFVLLQVSRWFAMLGVSAVSFQPSVYSSVGLLTCCLNLSRLDQLQFESFAEFHSERPASLSSILLASWWLHSYYSESANALQYSCRSLMPLNRRLWVGIDRLLAGNVMLSSSITTLVLNKVSASFSSR